MDLILNQNFFGIHPLLWEPLPPQTLRFPAPKEFLKGVFNPKRGFLFFPHHHPGVEFPNPGGHHPPPLSPFPPGNRFGMGRELLVLILNRFLPGFLPWKSPQREFRGRRAAPLPPAPALGTQSSLCLYLSRAVTMSAGPSRGYCDTPRKKPWLLFSRGSWVAFISNKYP